MIKLNKGAKMSQGNIVLIVLVVVFAILLIFSYTRRKNYQAQVQEMRDSVLKGDKVMTDSGVVGVVVDSFVDEDGSKFHIIQTGRNEFTSYLQIHSNSIYYVYGKENIASPAADKIEKTKKEKKPKENTKTK